MNKQLFIFFLSASLTTFGQSEPEIPPVKPVKFKRFAIGANFSPDVAYQTPHNAYDMSEESWEHDKESFHGMYSPRLAFTTGANVSWNFTKRLSLETGAQYSVKGYRAKPSLGAITYGGDV